MGLFRFGKKEQDSDPYWDGNAVYQELVGTSAICSVLEQMLESGSQLENCQLTGLTYQIDEGFEIR